MEPEQINECYNSTEVWDALRQPVLRKLPSWKEGANSLQRHLEEGACNCQGHTASQYLEIPVPGGPPQRGAEHTQSAATTPLESWHRG